MPYDARVLQILVASPGDVSDERDTVVQVLHEWNAVNSRERGLVLMPLRWETDTTPEMGAHPQIIINRQIVDRSDMVVGIFWTRLGTPTTAAESGTAEEIGRVGAAGKPVMLYFSRAKVEPDSLDFAQYQRLREFKTKQYPAGLTEQYSSIVEFREKFTRQLAMRILDIIAEDAASSERQEGTSGKVPELRLALAHGDPPMLLNPSEPLLVRRVICVNQDDIPDYSVEDGGSVGRSGLKLTFGSGVANKDYYREMVRYYQRSSLAQKINLLLENPNDSEAVRDLYLQFRARTSGGLTLEETKPAAPQRTIDDGLFTFAGKLSPSGEVFERRTENEWVFEVEAHVLQPARTITLQSGIYASAPQSGGDGGQLTIGATVYSSASPPFALETQTEIRVEEVKMGYESILAELNVALD
jgi:nucleoside 2-deoxyribosyltransferase